MNNRQAARKPSRLLTANEAEICLELWATKRFDTFDIACLLGVGEDAVARTIQTTRDIVRQLYAEIVPSDGSALRKGEA